MKKLVLTLVTASLAIQAPAAPTNEELKIGISQEFETMNPLIASMVASTYLGAMVNRQMVYLTADGKWAPQLAKSIPTLENGGAKLIDTKDKKGNKVKGLAATWEILETAKWGDGKPVTCEDIKFSWQIGKNPNVSIPSREAYEVIEKIDVDAKNNKKCLITLNKARFDYYQLVPTPMPKHLEESVLKKHGSRNQGYDQNTTYAKSPTNPGLYNGPYVISELKLGSHLVFTPNPHFYGKQPNIKKVIVKLIQNTGTLEANLRSGTIDLISTLGLTFDQALALEKKVKSDGSPFNVSFQPGTTYEHIDLNLDNPILKDVKVRKALVHAINREELVQALFEGKQKVAHHNISQIDPAYTVDASKVTLYNFNRREAERLLDEAGWKKGADGIREKDGQKLSLQFMTTAGNKVRENVQTMLQGQWKSAGVEVIIKNEPARVFFGETTKKRKYGAMAMYAWVSIPDSTNRSTLHSTSIATEKNGWAGQNYTGWANKTTDGLIDQFETEFSLSKRNEIAQKIVKEYTNDVPVIPLYYRADISVTPKNITGYKMTGHQFYETFEIENWNLGTTLK
jgi:peptide/nickel transport system substrate-binding protein